MDVVDVAGVGGKEIPLALKAGDAVVVVKHGLQAFLLIALNGAVHVVHRVVARVCVLPRRGSRLGTAGVVAGGEDQPIVADGPGDLLLFLPGCGMGPQVFHPYAIPGGHGYLSSQLLPVRAHHGLDVRADEVGEDGMRQVVVVRADEEQVELAVQAGLAVVVGDGGFQALRVVLCDGLFYVPLSGFRYVLRQRGMAGCEHQAVMKDNEDSPRLFLLGERVDAPSGVPVALFSGGVYQLPQGREPRPGADELAFQRGYAAVHQHRALGFVQEDQRASVLGGCLTPVERKGGVQPVLSVVFNRLFHVGTGEGLIISGLGFGRCGRRGRGRRGRGGRRLRVIAAGDAEERDGRKSKQQQNDPGRRPPGESARSHYPNLLAFICS